MQYTTHYNLMLPEGTDIVNPLVQDNPNYSDIDAALYANKLRVIGTATELTTGTVHAITRQDTDIPAFRFVATSNYVTGDTFTVDGVTVTVLTPEGRPPKNGAYVINSTVLGVLNGTLLTLIGVLSSVEADDVYFDNSGTSLTATNAEDAIKEVNGLIPDVSGKCNAERLSISGNGSITRTLGVKTNYLVSCSTWGGAALFIVRVETSSLHVFEVYNSDGLFTTTTSGLDLTIHNGRAQGGYVCIYH